VATAAGLQVDRFDINVLVGWAFAIAASSFCPLLVLGIWWRRLTAPGAIAGLVVGGGAASLAIVTTMLGFAGSGWSRVLLTQPAIWTVPLAFTTMIAGSLLSRHRLPHDVDAKLLQLHLPEALARTRPAAGPTPTRRRYVRRGPAPAPR
jgi:Na+(H+)/acetate symporter ActP